MPNGATIRRLAMIVVIASTVAACRDSQSTDETLPPPTGPPDATAPASTETLVPSTTPATVAPTTVVPTTVTPTLAPTTVVPTTIAPTTVAPPTIPPTTAVPAPTDPPPEPELPLALRRDGIGTVTFGASAASAVAAITALLGAPTADTGWVDPFSISSCAGKVARRVDWGALSLLLGDQSPAAQGRRHLYGFAYGTVGAAAVTPPGLTTPEGIGVGSSVASLRRAYPNVSVNPGESDLIDPSFFVSEELHGLLTGVADDDAVTVIFGGQYCA